MRDMVSPAEDRIISLSVHLPIPTGEAFGYFATQARVITWLAPLANVSPTVGGPYELFWDSEAREINSTIGCRVTAVAVGHFLAFQWRSPKQFACFANAADPLTHVVVMFFPEHSGSRIDLLHTGWRSTAEWVEARMWQERAWAGALEKLRRGATSEE